MRERGILSIELNLFFVVNQQLRRSTQSAPGLYPEADSFRQHRTMGTAGFGGSFAPIAQHEKWEIHPVFPHFSCFRLCQNLSPNLLAPLCGAAPGKRGCGRTTAPLQASPITGSAVIFVEDHVIQISRLHMEGKHF